MNRDVVILLSKISQNISLGKDCINNGDLEQAKNYIYDSQQLMGMYCDCAPIKLINGEVDAIIENYNSSHTFNN